ncbi:general transcription factor IIF subunit 1-like [Gigantopelta aegis]|uniref:general transcription factor IIF subunit 1-like n=1 Tax=Gigantopelta aegis TaxID=1735272 RepID=UPI001B88B529|nr:general transcription factor IIF subunit 1-like [Gigantopelta aegis]
MMASTSVGLGAVSTTEEHIVRIPRDCRKKFSIMKFASGTEVEFLKSTQIPVKIERENNLKEYKLANDIDMMPKFGAGSEYGREQKEEARKKKYGIMIKKYKPEDQPWLMKVGSGKNAKKYKGLREGTISENTAYYIFMQSADGAYEAFPVEEWYNFAPQIRYKYLNSEEAEEEFTRRDKTLNFFNIMLKKRMRNEDKDTDLDDGEKPKKKGQKKVKSKSDLMLTDMDDWAELSDEEDREEFDDDEKEDKDDDEKKSKKKGKKAKGPVKKKKNSKLNSDDEAVEESDEGDYDDKEVDYISDTSSSDSELEESAAKPDNCQDKGVDEEAGLRNLIDSEAEAEAEDEEKEENKLEDENEDDKDKNGKAKNADSDSDSSSSSYGSDSDIEGEGTLVASALLMQKNLERAKEREGTSSPKPGASEEKALKRKLESDQTPSKKARLESPVTVQSSSSVSDGITEEAIRRYLMRKPMTTKDLSQKFKKMAKKMNMTNEEMTHTIAQLLKRINPERQMVKNVLFLYLKKPE